MAEIIEIPLESEPQEKCEARCKKSIIGIFLTPDQQLDSFNARPYLMGFITLLRLIEIFYLIYKGIDLGVHKWDPIYFIVITAYYTSHFLTHFLIGIPLEIAHGTLFMFIFYISTMIYPYLVGKVLNDSLGFESSDPSTFAIVGLYFSNIVRKWSSISHRFLRIAILFIIGIFAEIAVFSYKSSAGGWRFFLFRVTCSTAGALLGFLFGFYWIYRNKNEDKPETTWRNYSLSLTYLTAFLLFAELSGIHQTAQEAFKPK
ncbi:unnamed protein product [Caenorhabditis angaria]|uniref:Uncharacterized protein n=1 Tax=Caenorhabditis angaria TaxID=860376 RepID=A0A9P1IJ56_9PELO|nr:unnamed protein product [Caenorhabditis angaria]